MDAPILVYYNYNINSAFVNICLNFLLEPIVDFQEVKVVIPTSVKLVFAEKNLKTLENIMNSLG